MGQVYRADDTKLGRSDGEAWSRGCSAETASSAFCSTAVIVVGARRARGYMGGSQGIIRNPSMIAQIWSLNPGWTKVSHHAS